MDVCSPARSETLGATCPGGRPVSRRRSWRQRPGTSMTSHHLGSCGGSVERNKHGPTPQLSPASVSCEPPPTERPRPHYVVQRFASLQDSRNTPRISATATPSHASGPSLDDEAIFGKRRVVGRAANGSKIQLRECPAQTNVMAKHTHIEA